MFSLAITLSVVCQWTAWAQTISNSQFYAVRPNSSEFINTLPFPNSVFKYKLRGQQTGGLFTLFEADYLTDGPGRHVHTREDELFHIIDGQVQFFVDGKQFCGATGDYVYVPRNIPQAIRIQNSRNLTKPVRIQILLAPSGLEGFLDEIAPLYYTGQDNVTLQNEIARRYGIINLDPVDWQDLGCFHAKSNSSKEPTSAAHTVTNHFSSLISFVNNIF
jgi:mannose-6-phosphate isomerase-like protein (cupin superfamily)